jgi:putative ABC transport system ATP-binding protein
MIVKTKPIHISLDNVGLNGAGIKGADPIVSGVSVDFVRESITAIIGPSGSGKSTLLRMINGLAEPDEGQLILSGVPYGEIAPRTLRRRVGLVFQEPALFPGTVAENLQFPFKVAGRLPSEWEQQARFGLERVNLKPTRFWDRDVSELSLGEKHRIALARTLLTDPEVLLLDEPTASLDPGNSSFIVELVQGLNCDQQLTVIWVTHTLDVARKVADQVVVMCNGTVLETGDATSVLNNPSHPETKRFLMGEVL